MTFHYVMLPNEILMYFRAQRKHQGDVSLSDALDGETEGGGLSLMDVLSVDDDMLERLDTRESCARVRELVGECLTDQERMIIASRYGLDNHHPKTQREIAALTGISRSYVSRIEKKALGKLRSAMERAEG